MADLPITADNDNYLKVQAEKIKEVKLATIRAASWSAAAPYTQTVSVAGIMAVDMPYISPYILPGITQRPRVDGCQRRA